MLTIRLQRTGKKNKVHYRLVLAEKTKQASKKFVEVLGSYNPHSKEFVLKNAERLQYWISQHVVVSPSAHNLLVTKQHIDAKKVKAFSTPKKAVAEAKPEVKAEESPLAETAADTPTETAAVETVAEAPTETETPQV